MLFFIFQLICSTPPSNVLERPDPKLNHLFVMASIACECSKTPSKDKPNQNAVVHSIMNPHLPKVLSSWYIKSRPSATPSLGTKMRFSKDVYLQAAQKRVKRVLNICCLDDEPNHEDSQGMIEKHNDIVSKELRCQEHEPRQSNSFTIDEQR